MVTDLMPSIFNQYIKYHNISLKYDNDNDNDNDNQTCTCVCFILNHEVLDG